MIDQVKPQEIAKNLIFYILYIYSYGTPRVAWPLAQRVPGALKRPCGLPRPLSEGRFAELRRLRAGRPPLACGFPAGGRGLRSGRHHPVLDLLIPCSTSLSWLGACSFRRPASRKGRLQPHWPQRRLAAFFLSSGGISSPARSISSRVWVMVTTCSWVWGSSLRSIFRLAPPL